MKRKHSTLGKQMTRVCSRGVGSHQVGFGKRNRAHPFTQETSPCVTARSSVRCTTHHRSEGRVSPGPKSTIPCLQGDTIPFGERASPPRGPWGRLPPGGEGTLDPRPQPVPTLWAGSCPRRWRCWREPRCPEATVASVCIKTAKRLALSKKEREEARKKRRLVALETNRRFPSWGRGEGHIPATKGCCWMDALAVQRQDQKRRRFEVV